MINLAVLRLISRPQKQNNIAATVTFGSAADILTYKTLETKKPSKTRAGFLLFAIPGRNVQVNKN